VGAPEAKKQSLRAPRQRGEKKPKEESEGDQSKKKKKTRRTDQREDRKGVGADTRELVAFRRKGRTALLRRERPAWVKKKPTR